MALNGTSEQIVLDCDFSYDGEDQLLVSSFVYFVECGFSSLVPSMNKTRLISKL